MLVIMGVLCVKCIRTCGKVLVFFLMIRRPPRCTQSRSSAASDVYKRQFWFLSQNQEYSIFHLNPNEPAE